MMMWGFYFMYFIGLISFSMNRKHLLVMLMILEFIILSLYLNMYLYLNYYMYEHYLSMIFLTMSVCESVLGLSILVSMIRSHGNDYFQSFSMLW